MADILVRVVYEGQTYDLDTLEDIPLRLDVSAVESQDIGTFTGVGSQQFVLPGTKANNRFFQHAYEIGASDVPAFYNTIQGYIIYDGETLLSGQFQLLDVLRDEDGYVSYQCTLQDTSVQFKDAIQSQLLIDGDWDTYNHTLNTSSVIDSWNDNLFSGSIFYPVVDYGIDEPTDFPAIPRVQLGSITSPNTGDINSGNSPMRLKQYLPAIKARDVLDIIFKTAGYRATGSFIESQDFNNTYILPKASEQLGIAGTTGSLQTFYAIPNVNYEILPAEYDYGNNEKSMYVGFGQETYDYGNNLTTTITGGGLPITKYSPPIPGKYTFETQVHFSNGVTPGNYADFRVWFCVSGSNGGCGWSNTSSSLFPVEQRLTSDDPSTYILSTGGEMELQPGDDVFVMFGYEAFRNLGGALLVNPTTIFKNDTFFTATQAPITYENAPVSMSLQFDQSTKSIDVIKGLIEQFNLVFTPEVGFDKIVRVETFDEWMWQGRNVDWTEKFNTAERVSITHTIDEQNRELLFGNEDDVDRLSVVAIDNAPNYQYGTLRLLSNSNIPQGSRKIGSYFGPTVLAGQIKSGSVDENGPTFNINTNSTFVFPHLYKFDNRQQKSFKFRPRLGYKVKNDLPIDPGGAQYTFNLGLPGVQGTNYIVVSGSYATLSNVDNLPVTGSTYDLHNNNTYGSFGNAGLNLQGSVTNYNRYWKNYVDSLYWQGARKVTMDVKFTPQEYKDIQLNDHVFIKDQQYRINKISGYNVTESDVVTVELIKLFPAYYQAPTTVNCLFTVTGSYSDSACAPPTPTPTPSAPCTNIAWTSASFADSSSACTYAANPLHHFGNGFTDATFEDGPYVRVGDTVFSGPSCTNCSYPSGWYGSFFEYNSVRYHSAYYINASPSGCLIVSESLSCGSSPAPTPTPTPSPAPTPSPTPTPVPVPVACTEWDLVCPSSSPSNCLFNVTCCDGTSLTNVSLIAGSECTYCASAASVVGLYGTVSNSGFGCSDNCLIGCQ